jgi:Stress responsive A/B Barrel Domain
MKLRHVVLFGFKEGTSAEAISELVRRFEALKDSVPDIASSEWGSNCSTEGKNRGHSHAFVLTFPSAKARDEYLPHPAHRAFVEWARPLISSSTVVDYWVDGDIPD